MTTDTPKELYEAGLITEDQFKKIDLIKSGKILSVFYELRSLLYLGVMLFTSGMGILIYQNIGELGHLVSIVMLSIITVGCFWYAFKTGEPFSNGSVRPPNPYFDYIVLLGSLLFICVQGYLQFQFGWLDENLGWSTLVTSIFFFYAAYRFDHLGVLFLAITALASFWSISVSPQKWYSAEFMSSSDLHITAIVFGSVLASIAILLDRKKIKSHFTFTYLHFCLLIFFGGSVVGLFVGEKLILYVLLIYGGCLFAFYTARRRKSFLFLLYAFLAAYTATTYLLAQTIFSDDSDWIFFYSILSCGGFVYFIIKFKNYFTQQP